MKTSESPWKAFRSFTHSPHAIQTNPPNRRAGGGQLFGFFLFREVGIYTSLFFFYSLSSAWAFYTGVLVSVHGVRNYMMMMMYGGWLIGERRRRRTKAVPSQRERERERERENVCACFWEVSSFPFFLGRRRERERANRGHITCLCSRTHFSLVS